LPIAKCFLEAGFHVVCDKPVTFSLDEARQLRDIVAKSGKLFAITYGYTGYPMVKLARDMVKHGMIGEIVKIQAQYPQGWLMEAEEAGQQSLNSWRTDPQINGKGGAVGDIGTHAANLAEYVSGLKMTEICAQLTSHNPARPLDDDGNCHLKFSNGAEGLLWASQVSIGELNALALKVFGRKGSLEWRQEYPTDLLHYTPDGVIHTYRRGTVAVARISAAAAAATRLPFGHPEALYESFANIYKNFAGAIRAAWENRAATAIELDFPTIDDGLRGMAFIDAAVESRGQWRRVVE
jgi:predicted dehydrogenase